MIFKCQMLPRWDLYKCILILYLSDINLMWESKAAYEQNYNNLQKFYLYYNNFGYNYKK